MSTKSPSGRQPGTRCAANGRALPPFRSLARPTPRYRPLDDPSIPCKRRPSPNRTRRLAIRKRTGADSNHDADVYVCRSAPQPVGRARYTRRVSIAARAPHGALSPDLFDRSSEAIAAHLEDAAHYPGGYADAVARPRTEADVAAVLAEGRPVLAVGAQSSLTGGATPTGAIVLSSARLTAIGAPGWDNPALPRMAWHPVPGTRCPA